MIRTVQFLNRGKEEDIEIAYHPSNGFSISLGNYCGDSCHVSQLSVADLVNVKHAIEEVIFKSL